ncbi:ribonuclease domain-containing protein [Propionivibrio sp.]|uniref:ribonuclease domain-containing protein n=1 Tax=Propionivibrio sp. TaxID=2212460 RepID=UPI003BF16562
MLRFTAFLRLALFLALAGFFGMAGTAANTAQAREAYYDNRSIALADLPPEAQHTLRLIQRGGPFPYPHKDGSTFGNFEKRLPLQARGYYREYTVPTPGSRDRGPRRLIAGSGRTGNVATSGEYYYTGDHYRSFRRIREP